MIEPDAFAEYPRRVAFVTANDARFFGVIVTRKRPGGELALAARRFDGVRDFVTQSERGRLSSAARRAQRAIGIPSDRIANRIEVIVSTVIDGQMEGSRG